MKSNGHYLLVNGIKDLNALAESYSSREIEVINMAFDINNDLVILVWIKPFIVMGG